MRTRGVNPTHYLFASDFLGPPGSRALPLRNACRSVPAGTSPGRHIQQRSHRRPPARPRRSGAASRRLSHWDGVGQHGRGYGGSNASRTVSRAGPPQRRDVAQPEDVLEWASHGGAKILGIGEKTGSLEVGKEADLFMVDTFKAHLVPTLRIVAGFVHNGQPADISRVMVKGRWLLKDGKALTIDEEDIIRRAEKIGHAVWGRLVDKYPNVPFPVKLPPGPLH